MIYGREIKPEDLPKIEGTEENWENGLLGFDEEYAVAVKLDIDNLVLNSPMHSQIDELDLSHLDVGSIDPGDYQQQSDDGCEGGACKI